MLGNRSKHANAALDEDVEGALERAIARMDVGNQTDPHDGTPRHAAAGGDRGHINGT